MNSGALRVYLGAAPGVGKTYRMLEEGHRRRDRGTDVVVGFVETHGRPYTEAMLDDLEVVPRAGDQSTGARRSPRWTSTRSFTADPTSSSSTRWRTRTFPAPATQSDGRTSRNSSTPGITVITTVNVQHLESINDVVQQITGVPQQETVPDEIVRRAEQIELVDMAPEALRRRMAHGNIYKPEKVDAALGNYFRVGNLTALRELALLWLADKVDDQLDRYRVEHNISATWEARERVVVALTGGPEGDTLIRRAARIAARTKGADLLAVHVSRNDGLTGGSPANLVRQRALVESLGGTYHQVVGTDIADRAVGFRPRRQRQPARARRQPARAPRAPALAGRRPDHRRTLRRDRRPPGHARGGRPRARCRRAPQRADPAPPAICGFALAAAGPSAAHGRPGASYARTVTAQRHPALPRLGRRGRAGRWTLAGTARRRGRHAAAQLLLHAADPQVHHLRTRERARADCLPGGRDRGQHHRRPGCPPYPRGGGRAQRSRNAVHAGGIGRPWQPGAARAARPASRGVRIYRRHAAANAARTHAGGPEVCNAIPTPGG